jgi:DNA-binding HxlR family transcriptional regulator
MKKKVSASSTERNGPSMFIPISACAGIDLERNISRLMPDISHKVLTETLRNLEHEGLITRTVYPEVPARVEYCISSHGETVRPIIQSVRQWEMNNWNGNGERKRRNTPRRSRAIDQR